LEFCWYDLLMKPQSVQRTELGKVRPALFHYVCSK
jgi:hypothetical protein